MYFTPEEIFFMFYTTFIKFLSGTLLVYPRRMKTGVNLPLLKKSATMQRKTLPCTVEEEEEVISGLVQHPGTSASSELKLSQYPSIHTNYIITHCTTL